MFSLPQHSQFFAQTLTFKVVVLRNNFQEVMKNGWWPRAGRLIWWTDDLIRRAEIKVYFHEQMPGEHREGRWRVYAREAAFNRASPSWHPDLCL